ncbi:hypothetical protein D3C86_1338460 [compost metagenome]
MPAPFAVLLWPVLVWLALLAPRSTLMLMPPTLAGSLATASYAFVAAKPAATAAMAWSRPLLVSCAASRMRFALCAALTTGLLALTVTPIWLVSWNCR